MPSIVQFRDKSHVLGIYSTPQRKIEEGLEYLRIGFEENNEAIVMVTDELTKEEVRNEIIKKWNISKYDLQDLERNSIINIKTPKETYFSSAIIDYEKTIKQFSDIAHASLKKGKKGLRSFADMKIFFETEHEEQLIEYEKSLPHSFDFPIIGLCAYDLDKFVRLDYKSRKIIFDHHNLHLTDNAYRSIFDISDNTVTVEHICMFYEDNKY
ncbi:MAG TPA: MEDS domain-containing protein [Nitrososphaeraceae archaeon]|nr:MEDS domain-containing protein [Nitrososphaeraceae archaeon]